MIPNVPSASGVRNVPSGIRTSGPSVASAAGRRDVIGTGMVAQPVSTSRTTGPMQPAQPVLIGSQGYDDLK